MTTHFYVQTGRGGELPIILPAYLARTHLIDITRVDDTHRRFLDTRTGEVHDCAEYARQLLRMEQSQTNDGKWALAETIKAMQELHPNSIALDASISIFEPSDAERETHLAKYEDWMLVTIRLLTPPPSAERKTT